MPETSPDYDPGEMTTTVHPAFASFMTARADRAPRPAALAGERACHALTETLDEAFRELARDADPGIAVVAVGGYGRREQCRHSDIDVMLLVEPGREEVAKRLLYPVWDTGVKVGHSIRTLAHVLEAGKQSVETLTALFDARFVTGNDVLFDGFLATRAKLTRAQHRKLAAELATRHVELLRLEPYQLQAANLKTGRGGLRDVQLLHWLDAAEAIAGGATRAPEPAVADARERLLATRNAVHALTERATDVFRDDLAPAVAEWLGVDLGRWSHDLYLAMRAVDTAVAERLATPRPRARRWLAWPRPRDAERPPPGMERDLDRLVTALHAMDPEGGPPPLEPLPHTDWLERLLPEWEVLRARRHAAPFHIHPVDVHTMRAVAEAIHLITEDDDNSGTPQVASELPSHDELLMAVLLHDIGKGHETSHVEGGPIIAERFTARAALPPETGARIERAVALHLLLPTVSTRRDIADERVIREVADEVGDAHTLRLLYLLGVADARATGPTVWNAWKAQLLRSLFFRTLTVLGGASPDAATTPEGRLQRVVDALAGDFAAGEIEDHVGRLEPSYLLSTAPEAIGEHIELIRELRGAESGTAVRHDHLGELDRLTIATTDRPGILQAVAGTLASHNANVLGGVAYTRDDGIAIQVWHVDDALGHSIDDRRWARILEAVPLALAGTFPIDERLAEVRATYGRNATGARPHAREAIPTSVHVDNTASDRYTVLEVSTADRRGLLYAITRALHELAIDIHLAKVNTIGQEVVDAFYVRRENGRRIETPDEIQRVESRVREAIELLDAE
jgi:[protein-PII] uridylyltransferase